MSCLIQEVDPENVDIVLPLIRKIFPNADIEVGDTVDVAVIDGVLVVTPANRVRGTHDLAQLVKDIGKGYEPDELDWGQPVGREVW